MIEQLLVFEKYSFLITICIAVFAFILSVLAFHNSLKLRRIQDKESELKYFKDQVELSKSFKIYLNSLIHYLHDILYEKQVEIDLYETPFYIFKNLEFYIGDDKYLNTFIKEFDFRFGFIQSNLLVAKERNSSPSKSAISGFLGWYYNQQHEGVVDYITECLVSNTPPNKPIRGEPDSIL